jgi:hypothetical protein
MGRPNASLGLICGSICAPKSRSGAMRSPGHSVLAVVLVVTSPAARRIQRCLTWKTRSLASFSFLLHWLSYFGHANDPEQRACQSAPFTRERPQVRSLQRPPIFKQLPAVFGSSRQNVTQTRRRDSWRARGICSPSDIYFGTPHNFIRRLHEKSLEAVLKKMAP